MTLEFEGPPPRRRPHRRFVGRRFYGPRYAAVYQEPVVIEVERTTPQPQLPWRITQAIGCAPAVPLKVVSQHASMEDALKAFKESQGRLKKLRPRCRVTLLLQHWAVAGWKTESAWSIG